MADRPHLSMIAAQPKVNFEVGHYSPPLSRAKLFARLALLPILLGVAGSCFLGPLSENFHLVIPGCVYRSGQLSAESLEERAARNGIRSVINLRGAKPGQDWYEQECALTGRQAWHFYDLPVD